MTRRPVPRRGALRLLATSGLLAWPWLAHGQAQGLGLPTASSVKAAFLYKFGSFVEWPAGSFASPIAPFVIGVFGDDAIAAELEQLTKGRDVGGHLHDAAVSVEETEPVASAGGIDLPGLVDELHALLREVRRQRVDVGLGSRAEGDDIQPLLVVLAEPDDVVLRRARCGQEPHAVLPGHLREAPEVTVERELAVEIGHRDPDVPQVRDERFDHVVLLETTRVSRRRCIGRHRSVPQM